MDRRFPIVEFEACKFSAFFGDKTKSLQAQLLSGGACNSNYLVEDEKEKFVCKIYNRGNPQLESAIQEFTRDLIPAPEYMWVGDGVSVMRYIEGQHFEPTENLVREAGRMIGRLSKVTFSRSGELNPDGTVVGFKVWSSYREGLLAFLDLPAVIAYLDEGTIVELRDLIDGQSEIFGSFESCHNLVHGDFRPDNILVSNDSIVGILDWEFTHSGCSYMDIGNLMRHISPKWRNDLKIGLSEEGFHLTKDWMFRASLIDLTSHLEFLTSARSKEFKLTCVERIHKLIKLKTEQGVAPNRSTAPLLNSTSSVRGSED